MSPNIRRRSVAKPPPPELDHDEPDRDQLDQEELKQEQLDQRPLDPRLGHSASKGFDVAASAGASALDFLASPAALHAGLVSLPSGLSVGRPDSLTPAMVLGWLPTLGAAVRDRWLDRLDEFRETPGVLLADGPPRIEAEAAVALARWRVSGDRPALRKAALDLVASSLEHGERQGPDALRSAWWLHPVLLAARLAGLKLENGLEMRAKRRGLFRSTPAVRPLEVVRRHLAILAEFLPEADVRTDSPRTEWILCLGTELWRETTPWSAVLRTPLEVAVWNRWRQLRHAESPDALTLATLLIAAENLHIDVDLNTMRWRLAALQRADGSFPGSPLLTVHPGPRHLGSSTLTTVLAVRALTGQPRTGGRWLARRSRSTE